MDAGGGPGRLAGDARPVLDDLVVGIRSSLRRRLLGLYLHGSLVLGGFDARLSDIDLVAVTDGLPRLTGTDGLVEVHREAVRRHPAWRDRIEVTYWPQRVLRSFPARLGMVGRVSPGEPLHQTRALPHWLTDLYSVQQHGVRLWGPPPERLLPAVTPAAFRAASEGMVVDWLVWAQDAVEERHQSYVRLAMCRSLYAHEHAAQVSKVAAAHWMAEQHPQWRSVVEEALRWRRSDSALPNPAATQHTLDLVRFVHAAVQG